MHIGLHGYLGTGNWGDHLMAYGIVQNFLDYGRTIFAFGEWKYGAEDFRKLGCNLAVDAERFRVRDLDALIIGGGALGIGFGWQLIGEALANNVPVISFGQSYTSRDITKVAIEVMKGHKLIVVRDVASQKLLCEHDIEVHLGADPAFHLAMPKMSKDDTAAIFVRAPNWEFGEADLCTATENAIKQAKVMGLKPIFALSAAGDAQITSKFGPVECDMITAIAKSSAVFSIGRYHPAVFATAMDIPWMSTSKKTNGLVKPNKAVLSAQIELLRGALCSKKS